MFVVGMSFCNVNCSFGEGIRRDTVVVNNL